MKKTYFILRLTFILPLLLTFLVTGSALVLLYFISSKHIIPQEARVIQIYLVTLSISSFFIGLALAYAIQLPLKTIRRIALAIARPKDEISAQKRRLLFEKEIEELFSSFDAARLNIERERRKELMQELSNLGILASGVAHEIRNPLGSINGLVDLLKETELTEQQKRYTDVIKKEVGHLNSVTQNFLKLTSGRTGTAVAEPVDIGPFLNEVIEIACLSESAKDIKVSMTQSKGPFRVRGDRDRLRQAFFNIVLNAIQAMGSEGGELGIDTRRLGNGFIEVNISDTGHGMDKEGLRHIFTPFYTTKARSIGLGLSITRQIIDAHSGYIDVRSERGKGTTFSIRLPEDKYE